MTDLTQIIVNSVMYIRCDMLEYNIIDLSIYNTDIYWIIIKWNLCFQFDLYIIFRIRYPVLTQYLYCDIMIMYI